jgi:hypothetical protein
LAKNQAAPKGKELNSNKLIQYQEEVNNFLTEKERSIDELAIYDEMLSGVLVGVREDIKSGLAADQIMAKYANIAAARTVTIALTDLESGKALAASKDILDRSLGKAVERKQIQHKLEKVDEKQLDAILITEISSLEFDEADEE